MDMYHYRNRVMVGGLLFLGAIGWMWKSMEAPDTWVATVNTQARVHHLSPIDGSYPLRYRATIVLPSGENKYLWLDPAPTVGGYVPIKEMRYKNGKKRYVFDQRAWESSSPPSLSQAPKQAKP